MGVLLLGGRLYNKGDNEVEKWKKSRAYLNFLVAMYLTTQ